MPRKQKRLESLQKRREDRRALSFEVPASALTRWNPSLKAAAQDAPTTFNIYSQIGDTWDGSGVTPDKLAAFLEAAAGKDVTINVNSPGGDFFDGLAMHTMLSEYSGNVQVNVVGLAASAASMLAMGGDSISIATAGLMMIHNAWSVAVGNANDMAEASAMLDKFDASMAKLYTGKTGKGDAEIRSMMDDETWMDGQECLDMGFADSLLGDDDVDEDEDEPDYQSALRQIDITLARAGMPRSTRRDLIKKITDTPSAVRKTATPSAGNAPLKAALENLLEQLKT